MKKTKEYRIKKHTYINKYGKESPPRYSIEYRKSFLFFKFWKEVTHRGTRCDFTTYFDTLEEAQSFADVHICGGKIYDGYMKEIIVNKKCNEQ